MKDTTRPLTKKLKIIILFHINLHVLSQPLSKNRPYLSSKERKMHLLQQARRWMWEHFSPTTKFKPR